jgi:hypothetical protein
MATRFQHGHLSVLLVPVRRAAILLEKTFQVI